MPDVTIPIVIPENQVTRMKDFVVGALNGGVPMTNNQAIALLTTSIVANLKAQVVAYEKSIVNITPPPIT